MTTTIERRFIPATEIRVAADSPSMEGYAALYNSMSGDLGGFREVIAPGAFKRAIGKSDIRALFNHDPNFVLGRTTSGTLTVTEDEHGLKIQNTPPDTQWARDLLVSMRRGDISQMSFAFRVAREGDSWEMKEGVTTRTIIEFDELFDVSPVTYPAYADTSVAVRSMEAALPKGDAFTDVAVSLAIAQCRLRQVMAR